MTQRGLSCASTLIVLSRLEPCFAVVIDLDPLPSYCNPSDRSAEKSTYLNSLRHCQKPQRSKGASVKPLRISGENDVLFQSEQLAHCAIGLLHVEQGCVVDNAFVPDLTWVGRPFALAIYSTSRSDPDVPRATYWQVFGVRQS